MKKWLPLILGVAFSALAHGQGFEVGFARRVITPPLDSGRPVYIAGFGHNRLATGVHDELFARCMAVTFQERSIVLVSVDLIGLSLEDTEAIRNQVQPQKPAAQLHMLVASTHNHQGPDTLGLWGASPLQSGVDRSYMEWLRKQIATVAEEALANSRPATLYWARTQTPGLIEDGRLPRVIDDDMVIAKAVAADGTVLGTLVNWGSHPEALGSKNTKITADYPSYLVARMESKVGGVCAFFSGTLGGMMTPLGLSLQSAAGETIPKETFEHAQAVGERAADRAIAALETARPSGGQGIEFRSQTVWIRLDNPLYRLAYAFSIFDRKLYTDGQPDARLGDFQFQGAPVRLPLGRDLKSEINYIRIGDAEILGVPGEIYPELVVGGIQRPQDAGADFLGEPLETPLKSLLKSEYKLLFGLANDEIGYIIPRSQWDEKPPFAYGRKQSQYGETNSCGDSVGPALAQAFQELILGKPKPQ